MGGRSVAGAAIGSSESVMPIGPLMRGSTGRVTARNLLEKMSMNAVRKNPNIGTVIMENMKDSRWRGWSKMEYKVKYSNGVNTVFIIWENGKKDS